MIMVQVDSKDSVDSVDLAGSVDSVEMIVKTSDSGANRVADYRPCSMVQAV